MHGNKEAEEKEDIEETAVKRQLYFVVYRRSANCFRLSESNECCGGGSSGGKAVCL